MISAGLQGINGFDKSEIREGLSIYHKLTMHHENGNGSYQCYSIICLTTKLHMK
jgi:hypothetical protein